MPKTTTQQLIDRMAQDIDRVVQAKAEYREHRLGEYIDAKVEYKMAQQHRADLHTYIRMGHDLDQINEELKTTGDRFSKANAEMHRRRDTVNRLRNSLKARIKRSIDGWDDETWEANTELISRARHATYAST